MAEIVQAFGGPEGFFGACLVLGAIVILIAMAVVSR